MKTEERKKLLSLVDVLSVLTRAITPEIERLLFNVRIVRDLTTRVCVTRDHSKPQLMILVNH